MSSSIETRSLYAGFESQPPKSQISSRYLRKVRAALNPCPSPQPHDRPAASPPTAPAPTDTDTTGTASPSARPPSPAGRASCIQDERRRPSSRRNAPGRVRGCTNPSTIGIQRGCSRGCLVSALLEVDGRRRSQAGGELGRGLSFGRMVKPSDRGGGT